MKKIVVDLTLFFLALSSTGAAAEMSPKQQYLLFKSEAMQLTTEQQPSFDKALEEFMGDIRKAPYKDYRASASRREAMVKQAITRLYEEFDEPVQVFLRDDQWVAFQSYKGALAALLLAEGYRL